MRRNRVFKSLFNCAVALSLLLFLTTALLWGRARWTWIYDSAAMKRPEADGSSAPVVYRVTNTPFGVMGERFSGDSERSYLSTPAPAEDNDQWDDETFSRAYDDLRARGYAGIKWVAFDNHPRRSWHHLRVPHWMLALLTGILPSGWAVGRWRHSRSAAAAAAAGCCPHCGYDLRSTPDRCPECGTVTDAQGAAAQTSA